MLKFTAQLSDQFRRASSLNSLKSYQQSKQSGKPLHHLPLHSSYSPSPYPIYPFPYPSCHSHSKSHSNMKNFQSQPQPSQIRTNGQIYLGKYGENFRKIDNYFPEQYQENVMRVKNSYSCQKYQKEKDYQSLKYLTNQQMRNSNCVTLRNYERVGKSQNSKRQWNKQYYQTPLKMKIHKPQPPTSLPSNPQNSIQNFSQNVKFQAQPQHLPQSQSQLQSQCSPLLSLSTNDVYLFTGSALSKAKNNILNKNINRNFVMNDENVNGGHGEIRTADKIRKIGHVNAAKMRISSINSLENIQKKIQSTLGYQRSLKI